ncbi:MAG TPA: NAD-glutamate dehydrogenase domain-containing protein, partial [Rickettsiales bacterium]|nr:NAD-glutamate dehydrogenase domain-containing protein [Rickettsiales bacterium]
PIYKIKRDKNGMLQEVNNTNAFDSIESVIQVHIEGFISKEISKNLQKDIEILLENIVLVVDDWKKIIAASEEIKKQIIVTKNQENVAEIREFISWLVEKGFIFLGLKEFDYKKSGDNYIMQPVEKSALGVFRSKYENFCPKVANSSTKDIADSIENPYILEILKSSYKSQIHRVASSERIRVQKFSKDGEVVGEYRLIGLFTSAAYYQSSNLIPLIRGKIAKVVEKSGFVKGSHNYKDLISVLEDYPRDELFQIEIDDLLRIASGIVMICGRNQIKLFTRKDKFGRFISCLVFMPKEHSNSEMREKIRNYLAKSYKGKIADSFVQITESSLVRLHVIIQVENINTNLNEEKIENEIIQLVKPWNEGLKEEIATKFGEEKVPEIFTKYKNSFSVSYTNRFDARRAAIDISRIESCIEKNSVLFNLYKTVDVSSEIVELKIYSPQKELILSEVMPTLESFGFNVIHEHTYVISFKDNSKVWVHYFRLNLNKNGEGKFTDDLKLRFEEAISLIYTGIFSVGSLNRLLVSAGLNWRQIYIIRAYAKYVYQAGYRYDQEYVSNILVKYSNIVKLLIEFFETKFDVNLKLNFAKRVEKIAEISDKIKSALNKVSDASHDIAIRKFFAMIDATLRTNFYQNNENGEFKGYVSFKFNCKKIPDLPLPLPYAEIFVYSNFVEGVHLRGGKVARGGLRWSDRHEDFRTEVLGLMKAQTTKNAVIVPVGSKGGFVVKKEITNMSRDEYLKEGIECYKTFLRGLLDLTDNVIDGKIVDPKNVVKYDETDPYLVVAADKGTATFSDIANSISAEYNF